MHGAKHRNIFFTIEKMKICDKWYFNRRLAISPLCGWGSSYFLIKSQTELDQNRNSKRAVLSAVSYINALCKGPLALLLIIIQTFKSYGHIRWVFFLTIATLLNPFVHKWALYKSMKLKDWMVSNVVKIYPVERQSSLLMPRISVRVIKIYAYRI